MKVLVVKLSSLGDVVHAMPAVQDMRRAVDGVQIDWVVERGFAPLVQRCQGVQRVITCDLRRWRKTPLAAPTRLAWSAFRAELQSQQYDAIIDLQGLTKSALVSWLACKSPAGKRFGLAHATDGSSFEAPARWVADAAISMDPRVHAVQRSRWVCAQALGYALPTDLQFGLRAAALNSAAVQAFSQHSPVVALIHGTSREDKQWPIASWVELGQRLNQAGFTVALAHGSGDEHRTSLAIAAGLKNAWVWPSMNLDAMTDTMAHCAGVVGVDSGLSHIAVALDLPHVQIYNFDTAWRTGPDASWWPQASAQRQTSVYAAPCPSIEAVWSAWTRLNQVAAHP